MADSSGTTANEEKETSTGATNSEEKEKTTAEKSTAKKYNEFLECKSILEIVVAPASGEEAGSILEGNQGQSVVISAEASEEDVFFYYVFHTFMLASREHLFGAFLGHFLKLFLRIFLSLFLRFFWSNF